ncbi:Nucleoside diphosphate-linked moiety X motif 6 [Nymphaea thermarum]|nr:Nucleoside diphosphate-linked moiety X motif 6 [Nymphaea thermarum]
MSGRKSTSGSSSQEVTSEVLNGEEDAYDGMTVKIEERMEVGVFASRLRASMSLWKQQGKKGVWLNIKLKFAELVPVAVQEGFWYHHAEPTHLMLVNWLLSTPHTLPIYATHRLGVGAVVINSKKEVLVVQEKSGYFRGTGVWKLPTGVVEEGEDVYNAAKREVKEETGASSSNSSRCSFYMESHKAHFNKISDMFFICVLEPKSLVITKQDSEILDAQWMPVEEYAAQPFVQKRESMKKIADLILSKTSKNYTGFARMGVHSSTSVHSLYLNNRELMN